MQQSADAAASVAIDLAFKRGLAEVTPDVLLLGCLRALSQFGIAKLGPWAFDLEALGIDWISPPTPKTSVKPAYSDATVEIFDRAARIARASNAGPMRLEHLLAAFADHQTGLMAELSRSHSITSAAWRSALADLATESAPPVPESPAEPASYLTPEAAAEALGIHVQTLRGYIRSGKLPARRLAGERAIRIRRSDLESLLEPFIEP